MHAGPRGGLLSARSATSVPHLEAVDKRDGNYQMLANGRVRLASRGEFVLDHQDDKHLYIAIYPAPVNVPTSFLALPAATPEVPVRDKRGAIDLIDSGGGLPHTGQWRDNFAVGDLLGDGSTQLVFAPPRKSGDTPLLFREQADGWHRVSLKVPAANYEYGGVAIADVDGDGRNDLVLAMHLTGFSALRAQANGTFAAFDSALPTIHDARVSGSGVAVLALPAPPRTAAALLLLREPFARHGAATSMPALATYRLGKHGFSHAQLAENLGGTSMAYAPATARCAAKLAVGSVYTGPPPLLETRDQSTWTPRAIDVFPDAAERVAAVTLGDADGDGCSDLAVAYSRRIGTVWHSVVDVYLDRGARWQRINLLDAPRGARVTAMTFAASAARSGAAKLLTLDDDGSVRAYDIEGSVGEWLLDNPAPAWRRGCGGSDIHVLPADASGNLRIAANFAGEPIMGAFDRCRNGGGIEVWRLIQRDQTH